MTVPDEVVVVTEPANEYLNQKRLLDYRADREDCLSWLLAMGKTPDHAEGYALGTVKPRASRMDQCSRWLWEQVGGDTAHITHDYADEWMRHLAHDDYSNTYRTNCRKAIKMLFNPGGDEWPATDRRTVDRRFDYR